jgi:hypothetical protein
VATHSADGIRFKPPPGEIPPEMTWVLLRALGPPGIPAPNPPDRQQTKVLVDRFGLGGRIIARQGAHVVATELGEDAAEELRRELRVTAGRTIRLLDLARQLAVQIDNLGGKCVLLKSAALHLGGYAVTGTRPASDIDILVEDERTSVLVRSLASQGWSQARLVGADHALPTLYHPSQANFDVHTSLPFIRRSGSRSWAVFGELLEGGILELLTDHPPSCFLPRRYFLIAHTLAHGWSPHRYPLLRMLADLQDLGLGDDTVESFVRDGYPWIAEEVSLDEVHAMARLCTHLEQGNVAALLGDDRHSGASRVLRHLLASYLDREYGLSLRLEGALRWRRKRPPGSHRRIFRNLFFPAREAIQAIYGPQKGRLGILKWRLLRPLDVLWRLLRYGTAWRRTASRSRHREHTPPADETAGGRQS